MKKITMLNGETKYFEETEDGYKEVEKKELIGGVFEEGARAYRIDHDGSAYVTVVYSDVHYGVQQGRYWKTLEEAERKVEIDNLIAKYRITDRAVLEDDSKTKYYVEVDVETKMLNECGASFYMNTHMFADENARKLIELITYEEWTKYVEGWR